MHQTCISRNKISYQIVSNSITFYKTITKMLQNWNDLPQMVY